MSRFNDYLSTKEIMKILNVSRMRVSALARSEGWERIEDVRPYLYYKPDVLEYRATSWRTQLLAKARWHPGAQQKHLYRDDQIDIACPVCQGFAIEKPPFAPQGEGLAADWICINGHQGFYYSGDDPEQWIELDPDAVRDVWDAEDGVILMEGLVFLNPTQEDYENNRCQATVNVTVRVNEEDPEDLIYSPSPPYEYLPVRIHS